MTDIFIRRPVLALVLSAVMLLLCVLPWTTEIAPEINGARRWLDVFGIRIQPSEVAKLGVIVWTAWLAEKKVDQFRSLRRGLLPFLTVWAIIVVLLIQNEKRRLLLLELQKNPILESGAPVGRNESAPEDSDDAIRLQSGRSQFTLRPIPIAILGAFHNLEQFIDAGTSDLRWILQRFALGRNTPDSSRMSITPLIPQRILSVSFHRVVPIADVQCPARSEANVDGNKTEIRRED